VTLNLQKVGSSNISLTRDTSKLKTDLQNLVNSYNTIQKKVDEYTGYDATNRKSGILQGDETLNGVLFSIRSDLLGQAAGFADGSDSYTLASQIGITVDRDGVMELDTSVLDDALESDYLGVLSLIGADRSGASDSDYIQFHGADVKTAPGVYETQVNFDTDTGDIVTAYIRKEGESIWRPMDIDPVNNLVTGQAKQDEVYLSLTAIWDGQVEEGGIRHQEATVRLRQGIGGTLYERLDTMTAAKTGIFAVKDTYIEAQIKAIASNIESKQRALADQEERLRARYARLEAMLSQMDSQRAAFEAMMTSVANNNSTS
jgi:flagellar hook-associated protein 2